MRASQSWLGSLLEHSQDLVSAVGAAGESLFHSPSVERVLGWHPAELIDTNTFALVHPEDLEKVRELFAASLERPGAPIRMEYRLRRKDGTYALLEGIGVNLLHNPDVCAIVINARDLTHQRLKDATTGLASKVQLFRRLERTQAAPFRSETFSLLAIGIDRLHEVEASLTTSAVERLLARVGQRLELAAGVDAVVSYVGFNRFAVLTAGTGNTEGALAVAARLRRALTAPVEVDDQNVVVTVGVGIVMGPRELETGAEDLLRDAEIALRQAMSQGLSRTESFGREMRERARAKLSLEGQLREAIAKDELLVHYQPIVRLSTKRLCGFEALVRWRKPDGVLVSPGAFIPVAESSGLIRQLDFTVMRKATSQLKSWLERRPDLFVNVNLSGHHFSDEQLVTSVDSILFDTGLPPSALKIELTETALVQNEGVAARVMESLRATGVRFGLDDFGTGYSALSYLQRFPFDSLKIDRGFISGLGGAAANPELVRAIIALAAALKLEVVAEGVEKAQELAFLETERCEFAQGYYFSRPVPADEAEKMLLGAAK